MLVALDAVEVNFTSLLANARASISALSSDEKVTVTLFHSRLTKIKFMRPLTTIIVSASLLFILTLSGCGSLLGGEEAPTPTVTRELPPTFTPTPRATDTPEPPTADRSSTGPGDRSAGHTHQRAYRRPPRRNRQQP